MKKILFILLLVNLVFCAWLYTLPSHDTPINYLYNLAYGLNFLLATYVSISFLIKCRVHRTIHLIMMLGSLSFFIAQLIWVYYNLILHSPIPYPGLADLFWVLFYPLTALGGYLIMRDIKIIFTWERLLEMAVSFGIIFFIIYSFLIINNVQENLPLFTQLLNLSYPFFDALLLTMTLTAIRSQQGQLQPLLLYFIFAFITLAFGDTLFAYQTTLETYWNGNIVDAVYALAGYFYAMGIVSLPNLLHPEGIKAQTLGTASRV